mmetsp:Transcript_22895/g.38375  ORF Transcript_22895/g.38375 Transcript_22895/m.38375 type:complete len:321 (-) Transcript_22895:78-1040(-)
MQRTDRHHRRLQRVDIAAGDTLQAQQNMGRRHIGINRTMRGRRVAALTGDRNLKLIRRRHDGARANGKLARRQARHIVQAIDFLNVPAVQHPIIDHLAPAAAALFGRLKDHHGSAVEIACFSQILRRPKQHRSVPVMTAGMHLARHGRGIVEPRRLHDRQRVHIRPQPHNAALGVSAPLDHGDNAGLADAGGDIVHTHRPQLVHDKCGGLVHVKVQFGMRMQMMAPAGNLGMGFSEAVLDGHQRAPFEGSERQSDADRHPIVNLAQTGPQQIMTDIAAHDQSVARATHGRADFSPVWRAGQPSKPDAWPRLRPVARPNRA